MRLQIALLFIILSCSAFSQVRLLDTRKHFQYTDTSFEIGELKILNGIEYNFEEIIERPPSIPSLDSLL